MTFSIKLPQNYCDNNHKTQRFDFFNECKLNDGACQFFFIIIIKFFGKLISILAGGAFLKSFSIHNFCLLAVTVVISHLPVTSSNSLDPDQDRRFVGSGLDPNGLTL